MCVLYRGPKGKARAQGCVRARKRALHGDQRSLAVCRYVLASQCTLSLALSVYESVCGYSLLRICLSEDARRPGGLSLAIPFQPQRPREACGTVHGCTHAGARVHWPRVSRGGRLVTEVRRQRQSSSPQPWDAYWLGPTGQGLAVFVTAVTLRPTPPCPPDERGSRGIDSVRPAGLLGPALLSEDARRPG